MPLRITVTLLITMGASCSGKVPPSGAALDASFDWPEHPDWSALEGNPSAFCEHWPLDRDSDDIVSREYWGGNAGGLLTVDTGGWPVESQPPRSPIAHTTALRATVYFVRSQNVFYVVHDCTQGHLDCLYGPFIGDPRRVLRERSTPH